MWSRQTKSGWLDGTIFEECIHKVVENVKWKRERMRSPNEKALLLLDGHRSRYKRTLWEEVAEMEIDVICIPAHTSNVTQPLDLSVNASFKQALEKIKGFPKKSVMEQELPNFVQRVHDCMHKALWPPTIRKGFFEAFLLQDKSSSKSMKERSEVFLDTLPEVCPPSLVKSKKSTYFNISGNVLTEKEFLSTWSAHECSKKKAPEKKKEEKEEEKVVKKRRGRKKKIISAIAVESKEEGKEEEDEEENQIQQEINDWMDDSIIFKEIVNDEEIGEKREVFFKVDIFNFCCVGLRNRSKERKP
jgi:hypothetical protein